MILINIKTQHTSKALEAMIKVLDDARIERLKSLYRSFEHLEYLLENDYVGMFASVDEKTLEILKTEYTKIGVNFIIDDITKSVLFGTTPRISDINKHDDLRKFISHFVNDNLTLDVVLDKINENGIESLSLKDKKILESV
jgi:hypothetical protein